MAYHTFEFLRKRRKDPKWRDAYLNALLKRLYGAVFLMLIFIGIIYLNDIDIMSYLDIFFEAMRNIF